MKTTFQNASLIIICTFYTGQCTAYCYQTSFRHCNNRKWLIFICFDVFIWLFFSALLLYLYTYTYLHLYYTYKILCNLTWQKKKTNRVNDRKAYQGHHFKNKYKIHSYQLLNVFRLDTFNCVYELFKQFCLYKICKVFSASHLVMFNRCNLRNVRRKSQHN